MGSGCCSGGDCGGGQDTPGPTPPRHDGPSIESVQTNKNNNNNINNNNNDRNDEEDDQGCCGTEGCDGDKASRGFLEAADATAADDCDDETCCAADNASIAPSTKTLECCNTNEEHCDGQSPATQYFLFPFLSFFFFRLADNPAHHREMHYCCRRRRVRKDM